MTIENHRIWRALLQLGQITEAVFEHEIPNREGLSHHGLTTLRLLRWHGPKTIEVISEFLHIPIDNAKKLADDLIDLGFVQPLEDPTGCNKFIVGLTPRGPHAVKTIVENQQQYIVNALKHIEPELRVNVVEILEDLTHGLVTDSKEFGISCASCWAHEPGECSLPSAAENCAFLNLHRSDLDPDPAENIDDCPEVCSLHSITRKEMQQEPVQIGIGND